MKIGLSYSRCVRDLVEGHVKLEDVLVVIARTDFDPRDDEQWTGIWTGYSGGSGRGSIWSQPEWAMYGAEHEQRFRDISIELYQSGKLHQPRQFGAHPRRLPYIWLETVLPMDEMEEDSAVRQAWDNFQILAGLTNTKLDREHRV